MARVRVTSRRPLHCSRQVSMYIPERGSNGSIEVLHRAHAHTAHTTSSA